MLSLLRPVFLLIMFQLGQLFGGVAAVLTSAHELHRSVSGAERAATSHYSVLF
jgi:hypothetical protein